MKQFTLSLQLTLLVQSIWFCGRAQAIDAFTGSSKHERNRDYTSKEPSNGTISESDAYMSKFDIPPGKFTMEKSKVRLNSVHSQNRDLSSSIPTELYNIAVGKDATQSSTYCCPSGRPACCLKGVASKAVDGNTDPYYRNSSVTRTRPKLGSWWKVNLGGQFLIEEIKVYQRLDSTYTTKFRRVKMTIFNNGRAVKRGMVIRPNVTEFFFDEDVIGDEVKIYVVSNKNSTLSLAEVEIYSRGGGGSIGSLSSSPSISFRSTPSPSIHPSESHEPSIGPSTLPTSEPTSYPSTSPEPSSRPSSSQSPSTSPSSVPTQVPTISVEPSTEPSAQPSMTPSTNPTAQPSSFPTQDPTIFPSSSIEPSSHPSLSSYPSNIPSSIPTQSPTVSLEPTTQPTLQPSKSASPTALPTSIPSQDPTNEKSAEPTLLPSLSPSTFPSSIPSSEPTLLPSLTPSTNPVSMPSSLPTKGPTPEPTKNPTSEPTKGPTPGPTKNPTSEPTSGPTKNPTPGPTAQPTSSPTPQVSSKPTRPLHNIALGKYATQSSLYCCQSGEPSCCGTASKAVDGKIDGFWENESVTSTMNGLKAPWWKVDLGGLFAIKRINVYKRLDPGFLHKRKRFNVTVLHEGNIVSTYITKGKVPQNVTEIVFDDEVLGDEVKVSFRGLGQAILSLAEVEVYSTGGRVEAPSASPTAFPTRKPTKSPTSAPREKKPNVIMIITDEHNFRTLGSYRRYYRDFLNQNSQGHVWGSNNFVFTPNLDKLADTGALFSNFYTVTPLCTPARASFFSGLYPAFTGESDMNHGRMGDDVTTFAEVLRDQGDYSTSFIGKWHLNGEAKPGWNPSREFGFTNRRFQYNRGHYKYFAEADGQIHGYTYGEASTRFASNEEEHFATDYLFDRGMEEMTTAIQNDESFAVVYSIPDPHGPNQVRKPYNTMYNDLEFYLPESGKAAMRRRPANPTWNHLDHEDVAPADAEEFLETYESGEFYQNYMQNYFGMVRCIDYNVGKLMDFLEMKGVKDDTIIVFTADHGDMLFEHGKMNKGRPYETSAGIPFIMNWPNKISPKVIETPYSSVDLFPTLLNLVGIDNPTSNPHGVDASPDLLSYKEVVSDGQKIVFSFDGDKKGAWVAAMMKGYKLVISKSDEPYLFDLNVDPDEMINFFGRNGYSGIENKLKTALFSAMKKYKAPLTKHHDAFFWDKPACYDPKEAIAAGGKIFQCKDIGVTISEATACRINTVWRMCTKKCGLCCQNSVGKIWMNGQLKGCNELAGQCSNVKVQAFCPSICGAC